VGKARRRAIAVIALLCILSNALPQADAAEPPPAQTSDTGSTDTSELPAGLQLDQPSPAVPPSMVSRWWFWTAVGAVAVATAAVVIASSRGSGPPTTNLGNQVFGP
jgi:hypothetical protein